MYEIIKEGKALIKIKKSKKISKQMDVFYNPVMKLNRDISVLLLNCIAKKNMQIALPLAGSGIRGIRFLKELKQNKIKSISFNDYSTKSVNSIRNNLKFNKITKNIKKSLNEKIFVDNIDANLFLLNSKGFDYIDIDPFGSSNAYLDSAIKRLARNGILAITNTDTAALTGTYPKACIRKYWAVPKRDFMMHETGLRILIRKIQLVGMQYEKALFPVFSYFREHYFRIFFQCRKGKKEADKIPKQHGMFNASGPLWKGNLWEAKLANKMHNSLYKKSRSDLLTFLKIIKEEAKINAVGFYNTHEVCIKNKINKIPKKEFLIKKIKESGYEASSTHFDGEGVRTNCNFEGLFNIFSQQLFSHQQLQQI